VTVVGVLVMATARSMTRRSSSLKASLVA